MATLLTVAAVCINGSSDSTTESITSPDTLIIGLSLALAIVATYAEMDTSVGSPRKHLFLTAFDINNGCNLAIMGFQLILTFLTGEYLSAIPTCHPNWSSFLICLIRRANLVDYAPSST